MFNKDKMEEFTLQFGRKKDEPLPFKEAVKFAKKVREYLESFGFQDTNNGRYFFDVLQIKSPHGLKPAYLNPKEILSFGVRNTLEILLLEETSILPSLAKKGEGCIGKYGCGFLFYMAAQNAAARINFSTYAIAERIPNPDSYVYIACKLPGNPAFSEYLVNEVSSLKPDCRVINKWDSNNWNTTLLQNNSIDFKIKAKKPQLSLENIFLLEHFKPFFEALDKEAKEHVVDSMYEYLNHKEDIIKYLEKEYPDIVTAVGRDRYIGKE